MRIANKIAVSFLVTALLLTTAAVFIAYTVTRNIIENAIFSRLVITVQSRVQNINTFLELEEEKIRQLSESIVLKNFFSADKSSDDYREKFDVVMKRLINTKKKNEAVAEIFVLDTSGIIIASSDRDKIGLNRSGDPYFLRAKTEPYTKDAYYSRTKKQPSMAFSAPILDSETEKFLGVVVNRIKLNQLDDITVDRSGLGKTGEICILNRDGYMVTRSLFQKDAFLKLKVDTENTEKAFEDLKKHGDNPHAHEALLYTDYRGVKVLGIHGHIPQVQWIILAKIDEKEILAPLKKVKNLFILILICVPILAWLTGVYISKLISKPLYKLQKGVGIIGQGNFDHAVGMETKDEIGQLSRAFDKMTESLKNTTVSKNYLNNIVGSMTDMLIVRDQDAVIRMVNKATCKFLGYKEEELIGKNTSLLFSEEEVHFNGRELENLVKKGQLTNFEVNYKAKNGRKIPVLLSVSVLKRRDCLYKGQIENCPKFKKKGIHCENLLGIVCVGKDITERKRIMDELKHLNFVLLAIREVNQLIVKEKDPSNLARRICDILIELRGYYNAWIVLLDESGKFIEAAETGLGEEFLPVIERIKNGNPTRCVRKALSQPDIVITRDPSSECADCPMSGVYSGRAGMTIRLEHDGKVYGLLAASISSEFIEDKQQQALFKELSGDIAFALHNIATEKEHKEAWEKVRFLSSTVEQSSEGIAVADLEGKLVYMNPAWIKMHGYESSRELIGCDISKFYNKKQQEKEVIPFNEKVMKKGFNRGEVGHMHKDGTVFPTYMTAAIVRDEDENPVALCSVATDSTEFRKMQKMLIESEKLASLGKLVSDMAHEVNNPLMIVSGRAQLSLMAETNDKEIKENLRIIMDQCMRAKEIIQRLLSFSKPSKGLVSEVNINEVIGFVVKLLKHQYTLVNITISENYEKGLPLIKVNEKQLHEVFMNLLKNSAEAMPDGGIITITTKKNRDKVRIDISDTGEGITEENITKLFDPFFTTKKSGTGLGLSVCYGLIKEHNGELRYTSEPGEGTIATIILPVN